MASLQWVADGREQLKRPLMYSAVAHGCLVIGTTDGLLYCFGAGS